MKKVFGLFALTATCALAAASLSSCGTSSDKIGFIFLHDENSSYDKNFIEAAKDVCNELNVTFMSRIGVTEGDDCYTAAEELVNQGCKAVFADSFGHEPYLIKAAKKYPDVEFCHATGTRAHTEGLDNYHNAFASIYQGRYVTGVAAGLKLNAMIEAGTITAEQAVMGYVGAFPYAEVVSGYTSFYLGAKSVCPSVTMSVRYTNSWYSIEGEASAATALIDEDKAVIVSQHADSMGAPGVCEEKGVPNVFYNGTNDNLDTYLIASRINWRPYFRYMINSTLKGEKMNSDWYGTIENGAVEVLTLNETLAASGTKAALDKVISDLKGGLEVFNTANFTVDGKTVTSYEADVNDDPAFTKDTQVIENGVFKESTYRSAPYFDMRIDGIIEKE